MYTILCAYIMKVFDNHMKCTNQITDGWTRRWTQPNAHVCTSVVSFPSTWHGNEAKAVTSTCAGNMKSLHCWTVWMHFWCPPASHSRQWESWREELRVLHGHFAYAQTPPVPQQPEKPNTDTNSVTVGELHIHNILLLCLNHTSKSCGYMEVSR